MTAERRDRTADTRTHHFYDKKTTNDPLKSTYNYGRKDPFESPIKHTPAMFQNFAKAD
jgi:hypothetical protein